ncbi:hypothetical protein ACFWIX_08780 [Pseudarthrobacter sp. NPDC058362]|uniref:hypothetical protein n=1 Tax=Pseudarthrobacter sp. NPDC058362 TaxID=3346458 RepID=UPI0036632DAF
MTASVLMEKGVVVSAVEHAAPGGPGPAMTRTLPYAWFLLVTSVQTGVTAGFAFIVWLWTQALYDIGILCPFFFRFLPMLIPSTM